MQISRPNPNQIMPDTAELKYSGKIFSFYEWPQILFNGEIITYERVKRLDTVVLFPILPNGKILLSKQIQPGTKEFVTGLGGKIDPGEDVLTAANRELQEESGYHSNKLVLWKSMQPQTKIDWAIYFFIAKDLEKVSEAQLEGGEKIELIEVDFAEFLQLARQDNFGEKEIIKEIYEALLEETKYIDLQKMFSP